MVVPARGPTDFGWDPVFAPDEGAGLTRVRRRMFYVVPPPARVIRPDRYAEMDKDAKNAISHRGRALARRVPPAFFFFLPVVGRTPPGRRLRAWLVANAATFEAECAACESAAAKRPRT